MKYVSGMPSGQRTQSATDPPIPGGRLRILLVNAFHWLKGGVERTYLDESRWLTAAGHDVLHFATRDPRNLDSPTARFFAPPADFGEGAPALAQLRQLDRALWSRPAQEAMAELVRTLRPDVAHVHAPSRYLTPSVLRPLEAARVPVVMTLHDFKPWCTNRILFALGEPCERCRGGAHWHAAAVACVQRSRAKAAIGSLEAYLHDALGAYRAVQRWICPSHFVRDKALGLGAESSRLRVLAHGVETPPNGVRPADAPPRYVLFAARLSEEKGVGWLPAIARAIAPVPLLVAGEGPQVSWLEGAPGNLRRLGHLGDAALAPLRAHADVVISPSLFQETFGYTVAEALLDARPAVATSLGALPELIRHEHTGLLSPPGDPAAFAAAVRRALEDPAAARWGAAGRAHVVRHADPVRHTEGLLAIYREVLEPVSARRG